MKLPYSWLAEWVELPWTPAELGARLTHGRLRGRSARAAPRRRSPAWWWRRSSSAERASAGRQAARLPGVDAAAASRCRSSAARANARAGLKAPLAHGGRASCPGELDDQGGEAARRGIAAACCARRKELGWRRAPNGILELPADAPVGKPLREYLDLDDAVLELNVTPNRGDAMSVLGIAREVAALTRHAAARAPRSTPVPGARRRRVPGATSRRRRPARASPAASIRGIDNRARDAAVDAGAPAPRRPAPHQPGRRRHQLRDARARPAHARLRSRASSRAASACAWRARARS